MKNIIKKYHNLGKNNLFRLNRSLTGKDTLKTLKIFKAEIPEIKIKKIKCRSKVFDWVIPDEWNVKDAYILDKNEKKILDFQLNNLHLVGYSIKQNKIISKKELKKKIHYLRKIPDAIPYVTSYYKKSWGFCMTYRQFKEIDKKYKKNDKFKIVIDASLKKNGYINYGELIIKGRSSLTNLYKA